MSPSLGRVLIVDDDPAIRELLVTRLQLAGYWTATANDGAEAMDRLPTVLPDAMILDLGMPRVDGFEVLRKLQRRGAGRRTPVMVMSARGRPEDVRTAIELGAQDYMTKPFQARTLLTRVARLMRPAPVTPPKDEEPGPDEDAVLL